MSRRFSLITLCVVLLAMLPAGGAAQTTDIGLRVEPFFDGTYRSGSWLPFRITVSNDGPDVNAVVSLQLGATYQTTVDLPRGANKSLVMYAQAPGVFRRNATARVLVNDIEARTQDVPLSGFAATNQVIGVLAAQPITLPLPGVTQQMRQVRSLPLTPDDLPERVEGLSMFDVLVLDGAPLIELNDAQRQALRDWVHTGGQLVLGGALLDETLASLPDSLRVTTTAGPAPAGANSLFPELNNSSPPSLTLATTQDARVIATQRGAPVGVQQTVGKGSVTVLGWSLSAPELRAADTEKATWRQIVRLRSNDPNSGFVSPDAQGQQLGWALMQLPVLAIPPLGALIALLGAYILIVGPGLYLLLRRLDRQVWGWGAIPLVTLLFTLGAYGYGLRIRGNDVILNQISVVEPSDGRARVRTYAGIFSPRDDSYTVKTDGDALFRPMPAEWGQGGTAAGRFLQNDGGVEDLRVAQWSMSTFTAEQMIDGAPLESNLTLSGAVLRGSVRNAGDAPLRDVTLFQNMRVLRIGDLEPGQTRAVELDLSKDQNNPWAYSVSMLLMRDRWDFNQPTQPPADIRMQMMVLDAIFSSPVDRPTEPYLIGWMERAPIPLEVDQARLHRQQTTLVLAPAKVAFDASGPIALPGGWLKPAIEGAGQGGPCMNQWGSGWYLDSGVITTTLQLPPALQQQPIAEATMMVRSDGPPLPDLILSAYDWNANDWVQQRTGVGTHRLDQPARYVSSTGQIMLRAEMPGPGGKGGGCITIDLSVTGAQS